MKYPEHWPKPDKRRPDALASRITEDQKEDLYQRRITTRKLAVLLEVHERYLSYMFPGKVPLANKKVLIETRKLYKLAIAKEVIEGKYSTAQAARIAYVSYNTMRRFVKKARNE